MSKLPKRITQMSETFYKRLDEVLEKNSQYLVDKEHNSLFTRIIAVVLYPVVRLHYPTAKFFNQPFEQAFKKGTLQEGSVNFSFTSPPFWNKEEYKNAAKYDFDTWLNLFFKQLVINMVLATTVGGTIGLHLPPREKDPDTLGKLIPTLYEILNYVFETSGQDCKQLGEFVTEGFYSEEGS